MNCTRENRVRAGVLLPSREAVISGRRPRQLVDFAERAEHLGFDSVWAGDSLTARPRVEPLTLLAAVAARTSRITLGTAALTAALRNPVTAAHAIATVDQLSEGRLVLALGAGFPIHETKAEFAAVGMPFASRISRLVKTVELWRGLWGPSPGNQHAAGYIDLPHGIDALPRPVRPGGPPLWLAGAGPKALERTGRLFDGWLPYPTTASEYAAGLSAVREAASNAGRTVGCITPALYATVVVDHDRIRALRQLDEYAHAYYGFSGETLMAIQTVIVGAPDECSATLIGYLEAGATHIVARIGTLRPHERLDHIAQVLLPAVQSHGLP
jgi:alkanesulfonate monooxygenase SsuD/methylene tetrahydromethanopterin reductase-like flavin-dependent oxidoreductase (luciferase family)